MRTFITLGKLDFQLMNIGHTNKSEQNFPAAMVCRKIGPVIASGCTCVIKAPSETPFSVLALAEVSSSFNGCNHFYRDQIFV